MNREKINFLKAKMRKVTDEFNLKFLSTCDKCDNKHEVDLFDYFASIFITCPQCKVKATHEKPVHMSNFGEVPFYKQKFVDGHFKVIQQLTVSGIDFSQDIVEGQEVFFDYNWDFANGVADIYTSLEMFLYELTCKKLEELVTSGKKINIGNPKFEKNPNILELVEKINSHEIFESNIILEEVEGSFRIKDCRILLEELGAINKKDLNCCYDIQKLRNNIVHRGQRANFEDYADIFIEVGRIFNVYKFK